MGKIIEYNGIALGPLRDKNRGFDRDLSNLEAKEEKYLRNKEYDMFALATVAKLLLIEDYLSFLRSKIWPD